MEPGHRYGRDPVVVHRALAAAATVVAVAFTLTLWERYRERRGAHHLMWFMAMVAFSGGAGALWWGATFGWTQWPFRVFFALGAVVNVPVLALGTVHLLADGPRARRVSVVVGLAVSYATGVVVAEPLRGVLVPTELPRGSDVFGPGPRIAAALASGGGAVVIAAGAVFSIVRALRGRAPRRVVATNAFIVAGTAVLSAGGLLNSVLDEMDAFAVSLVAGVSLLFVGFLTAR